MIVTPDFVYIHYPKTGGTFVTTMLERLYPAKPWVPARAEHFLRRTVRGSWPLEIRPAGRAYLRSLGRLDLKKHGSCFEVPDMVADRPLVSSIRNPYDRYVSMFEFPTWRVGAEARPYLEVVVAALPHFPEITFREFVEIVADRRGPWGSPSPVADVLGFETRDFIFHFCRHPDTTVQAILRAPEDGLAVVQDDLYPLEFLRTEHLNQDLADYLRRCGRSDEELVAVQSSDKIFPPEGGRAPEQAWEAYYTPDLRARVRQRERILFELFPGYDV